MTYSTRDCALTCAGNPAPPAPTTPQARNFSLSIFEAYRVKGLTWFDGSTAAQQENLQ
jgi:hypothetical protein